MNPEILQWIVDGIIALIVLEAVYLFARFNRGTGLAPINWLPSLISGVFLLLAMRAMLVEANLYYPILMLLAAGLAHLVQFMKARG